MGEITYLLSTYSGAELVIIFVVGLLAVTAILKAFSYIWELIKNKIGMQNEETN